MLVPGLVITASAGPLPGEEWPFILFDGILLALPFAYLAIDGTKKRLPWVVAIVLSAMFWGALLIGARSHSGVHFGLALATLVSPLVITFAAWLANRRA